MRALGALPVNMLTIKTCFYPDAFHSVSCFQNLSLLIITESVIIVIITIINASVIIITTIIIITIIDALVICFHVLRQSGHVLGLHSRDFPSAVRPFWHNSIVSLTSFAASSPLHAVGPASTAVRVLFAAGCVEAWVACMTSAAHWSFVTADTPLAVAVHQARLPGLDRATGTLFHDRYFSGCFNFRGCRHSIMFTGCRRSEPDQ